MKNKTTHKFTITQIIAEVKAARLAWLRDHTETPDWYSYSIGSALACCSRKDATIELKLLTATLLPDYVKFRVHGETLLSMRKSKHAVKLLQDKVVLDQCLAQPDGEKTLAWLCLHRAYECEAFAKKDKHELTNNIMLNWLGRGMPKPKEPKLLETAAILYGGHPALQELLDFQFTRNLATQLWKQETPISKTGLTSSTELPSEMNTYYA